MTSAKALHKPGLFRAGGVAAALALSISGGAYAAVQATAPGGDAEVLPETAVVASAASADTAAGAADVLVAGGDAAEVSSVSEDEVDAHQRVEQQTDTLPEGETEVQTEGVDGVTRVVYRVTSVDGKETSREVISRVAVSERVDEVVLVGTGSTAEDTATEATDASAATASGSASSSGSAASGTSGSASSASAGDDSVWAALAQCESGGNPAAVSSNGKYYGLYQFSLPTWQALGGTGYPYEADAATQTAMAKKLQAQSGWGQWPACAASLGLL